MRQSGLGAAKGASPGGGHTGGIGGAIIGKWVALCSKDHCRRQARERAVAQGGGGRVTGRFPTLRIAGVAVEKHIVAGQQRGMGMGQCAAMIKWPAEAGINQDLTRYARPALPCPVRDRRRQRSAGTVACQQQRPRPKGGHPKRCRPGIVEMRRVAMFGRQSIIGGNKAKAGFGRQIGADRIVAFQSTDHKAAAMKIKHRRRRCLHCCVDAAGHRVDRLVMNGHSRRAGAVKGPAHLVIDPALIGDRIACGFGGIPAFAVADKCPGLGIDQGGVVGHVGHGASGGKNARRTRRGASGRDMVGAIDIWAEG